jgi:2-polyprenyl-6-methoxyphenol hydroxylase-like FAD-dependent oxidoreductase
MRILVVGAGIAGLATHRALSLQGFNVEIVERSRFAGAGGAGLFLPGNSVRAVNNLGLGEALRQISYPIKHQRFCDEDGKVLNSIDTGKFWGSVAPCRALRRADLWELLKSGISEADIQYRTVTGLSNLANSCRVHFDDGEEEYDLVVGADGVNSTIRSIVFPEQTPQYVGNVCWRFIVPNVSKVDAWTVMLGADRSLLGKPISSSELYMYADISAGKGEVSKYSSATPLEPLFHGISGPLAASLKLSDGADIHFSPLVRVQMDSYYRNRVLLVGDAAHAAPPSMAQGAGMGLEDALVLADELVSGGTVEDALQRYQVRRSKRVNWVHRQNASRDTMRRLPPFVRSSLLRLAGTPLYRKAYGPLREEI